ncbi:ParA family protein [Haloferula sargassicola]|uniref:Iron-sulfur cluster carrier protein n=1 Tax=Haloferula sargassicola TaxID=490096 RepID=A0ABP9URD4_9BACT
MFIGVVNQKGGVGKSTLAVHLAAWLYEKGVKVALVDADSQSSSTEWLSEAQPEIDSFQWQEAAEIFEGSDALRENYEVVVFDGPAGLNAATKAIMVLATGILIPCGPSILDLRALEEALIVVREVQITRPDSLPVVRLVPNKLQKRYRLSQELMHVVHDADVAGSTGLSLLSAYADAAGQGTVVWRMGSKAEKAAREMNRLFDEILSDTSTLEK